MDRFEPKHALFDNIEEMLSTDVLSDLLKQNILSVECRPFDSHDGFSGNTMSFMQAGDQKLVMKRLRPKYDWKSIASQDHRSRSVVVWQYGLLDRIRPHMEHKIIAACRDIEGHAILMHDVTVGLFYGNEITRETVYLLLDALAAMHAIYWEDESLQDPALGLCEVEKLIKISWPEHCTAYSHDTKTIEMINKGWEALFDLLAPDVRDLIQLLMAQPQVMVNKLAKFPSTFIHADYRTGNLALLSDANQVVALDWQDASYAPAVLCLCWFIISGGIFEIQEDAAEYYRQQLTDRLGDRLDPGIWQPMLDVGCMVEVLRKGNWHALFATSHPDENVQVLNRKSVQTYNNLVRKGIQWL
jgi:hypothetical protein